MMVMLVIKRTSTGAVLVSVLGFRRSLIAACMSHQREICLFLVDRFAKSSVQCFIARISEKHCCYLPAHRRRSVPFSIPELSVYQYNTGGSGVIFMNF